MLDSPVPGNILASRTCKLEEAKMVINLTVVSDGMEAMAYLRQEESYTHAVRPDLILLDLNLPRKDGREVLNELQQDDALRSIPVVVLTTSQADEDIARSYGLGANAYITKPVGFDGFVKVVQAIKDFWFTVVKLPPR